MLLDLISSIIFWRHVIDKRIRSKDLYVAISTNYVNEALPDKYMLYKCEKITENHLTWLASDVKRRDFIYVKNNWQEQ